MGGRFCICATCGQKWPADFHAAGEFGRHLKHNSHVSGGIVDDLGIIIKVPKPGKKSAKSCQPGPVGNPGFLPSLLPSASPEQIPSADITHCLFLRLVPKTLSIAFTPIMRTMWQVAVEQWGWNPSAPFEDLIDTIFYNFAKGCRPSIILGSYLVVDDNPENEGKRPGGVPSEFQTLVRVPS